MRKIFVGIILVFIIFSTMMILIREAPSQELRIKTLYSQYSRLITSQSESLTIPVFVSDEKTFLVDLQLIEYAALSTTNALIEVEVTNIIATDNYETYQNIDYRIYDFEMTFPMMESTDDFISLSDCRLSITYQNQDVIDLNIGDVFLRFSEVNDPGHIDLYRLYATTDMSSFEFVSGIVLGLTNLTSLELTLTSIDLGFDEINVDMQAMSYIEYAPGQYDLPEDILGVQYESLGSRSSKNDFELDSSQLLYMPLYYGTQYQPVNRFPIVINYTFQGSNYSLLIDDFQYFSTRVTLEGNDERIRETVYRY